HIFALKAFLLTDEDATISVDAKEWKKAIASELGSLTANKTWKLVPRPTHQRPIGCRWVFALKRNEEGNVIRHKARLVAKGYSQRRGIDYEETYSSVFDLLFLFTSLYGLKQASRVWNETIDAHLKTMGFKAADADPCLYTRGEGDDECIVCLGWASY
ncbi:Integrase catalytic core protein, partial [Phytophthora palmivora]